MTRKAWFGWTFIWPIAMWSERRYKCRGDGTLYGYVVCLAWWARLGRWADATAYRLAEVNFGTWQL